MKKFLLSILLLIIASVVVAPVLAQETDSLIGCVEEVKQLRAKDGPRWFANNKTSCLGEGAIGAWSVLPLPEYDEKEVYNDMEFKYWVFFDTPVAGVEAREDQMEYQKTGRVSDAEKSAEQGWRIKAKMEYPTIGDKSTHFTELRDIDIAISSGNRPELSPIWANEYIYEELVVIVGECSFLVGGRGVPHAGEDRVSNWGFNHNVHLEQDFVIVNNPHDHGEVKMKQRMEEIAGSLVGRVSGVCGSKGATEPEKTEPAGWELPGKGFGEFIRKIQSIRLGKPVEIESEALSEKKTTVQSVNDWILENLGPYEPVIETKNIDRAPILTTQAGSDEALRLTDEMLAPGAKVETSKNSVIITKPDGSRVWFEQNGDVIYYKREDWTTIRLKEKEVEVQTEGSKIEVETPGATIKTKGTHYWVSYDPNKNQSVIGVYEGEVEVKTRDGKTITVKPENGDPGVVVVSQKLSVVKLAITGVVLAAVIGGIVWLVKKKTNVKSSKKR